METDCHASVVGGWGGNEVDANRPKDNPPTITYIDEATERDVWEVWEAREVKEVRARPVGR
jgi:hypothetical protein